MLYCCLGAEDEAEDVEIKLLVEGVLGDGFDRGEIVDAGVVDEDIEAAEAFLVSAKRRVMSACLETSPWTAIALPPLLVISATTLSAPDLLEE